MSIRFDHALSFDPIQQSAWMQLVLAAAGVVTCIAAVALVAGALSRPPHLRIAAAAGIVIPGGILAYLLAVPAHPTTYLVSSVQYTADAIATGSTLYATNCSACHGGGGRGDDSVALFATNPRRNLDDRVPGCREGDLFWSIARGVPGTPMPGFASQLNDVEIWSLIQYLDARSAAQNALAMSDRIKPLRPVPAPDFTYELMGHAQESLRLPSDNRVTLLVFYTLPFSLPRLRELAMLEHGYATAGARVTALPMPESSTPTALDTGSDSESMLAFASSAVATTYLMFAREGRAVDGSPPAHLEYLIDRFWFLRLRWIGAPEAADGQAANLLGQIDVLVHEPPRALVQWGHGH